MIGVIAKSSQQPTVKEFFQLFKVQWEYYNKDTSYDVVIITDDSVDLPSARLIIVFSAKRTLFDTENDIHLFSGNGVLLLDDGRSNFPIYRKLLIFQPSGKPFITVKDKEDIVGLAFVHADKRILRIGYDLFDEVEHILNTGQKIEYAQIPTVDIHIALLRSWILESGLPLLEIPPIPHGYKLIACLTHDVDFISIRSHKLDHSVLGFMFRVFVPYSFRDFRSNISWKKFVRNLKALILLPGVYLCFFRDIWFQIDRYMEIEDGLSSTFYFIPFQDDPGDKDINNNCPSEYRASRYDINEYKTTLLTLIKNGHEVGLHGIDAWHSSQKGIKELNVIRNITGEGIAGIRMHWLYFSEETAKALEDAGFIYDSTIGYNETSGYKAGTSQVYRLSGSSNLLELPLIVMDTSLFYSDRLSLSEADALSLCNKIIKDIETFGGVFTINWHQRSLAPERNWDDFYIELLRILKEKNAWFATAGQAVNWFNKRRSIKFNDISYSGEKVYIKFDSNHDETTGEFSIRFHYPQGSLRESGNSGKYQQSYVDIPWAGEHEVEFNV